MSKYYLEPNQENLLFAPMSCLYVNTTRLCLSVEAVVSFGPGGEVSLVSVPLGLSLSVEAVVSSGQVGKSHSFLYHSACIWGVETYPPVDGLKSLLPPGSFVTCSSDDTIRLWNLDPNMPTNTVYKRNIYSNVSGLGGAVSPRYRECWGDVTFVKRNHLAF